MGESSKEFKAVKMYNSPLRQGHQFCKQRLDAHVSDLQAPADARVIAS